MFGPVPILNHAAGKYPRRYLFQTSTDLRYSKIALSTILLTGMSVFFEYSFSILATSMLSVVENRTRFFNSLSGMAILLSQP